MNSVLSFMISD